MSLSTFQKLINLIKTSMSGTSAVLDTFLAPFIHCIRPQIIHNGNWMLLHGNELSHTSIICHFFYSVLRDCVDKNTYSTLHIWLLPIFCFLVLRQPSRDCGLWTSSKRRIVSAILHSVPKKGLFWQFPEAI